MAKDQTTHIGQDGFLLNLLRSRRPKYLSSQMAKYLTQPQTVEQLSGWQDSSQGRIAKEKGKRMDKPDKSELSNAQLVRELIYIKGPWMAFNKV